MFLIYCCCCSKPAERLLSVKTKSSHADNKTLLDYLNSIFGSFLKRHQASDLICIRCSKALQVAYHFISMVNKLQKVSRKIDAKRESLENVSFQQTRHEIQDKQNTHLLEWHIANPMAFKTNRKQASQNIPPFHMTNSFKLLNKEDFMCNICRTSFDDKTSFLEHTRQKHKEIIPYKCKLCSFYTCYAESLFKHCKKNHGLHNVALDLYQRKEVPKVFDDNPEFEITYSCSTCNFEDPNRAVVDVHLLNEHSIEDDRESFVTKLFSCPACCRSFRSLKSVKIHYSMHHISSFRKNNACKKRKFRCEKCGKFFDLKSGLFAHKLVCEQRKFVNCNFCNMEFTSVLKYERHLQATHFVAIKHECETCSKTFNCSEYLAVHRKRHNERNFQCELCPKNYITNAELKLHKMRIHDIKHAPIACDMCKRKFANLTLLKYHANRMHKADVWQCDFCEFASNSRSALKVHQFDHTGKPYKCHLCEQEFVYRVQLRQHLQKHHSTSVSHEVMAEMFKQANGYTSRFDAFSEQNNSLEITEMSEMKLENEIEESGFNLENIMKDLFHQY